EELLLAGEVVVERFAGHVGTADDVGDLGRLVALLGAKFGHRVDHPPSLVGGDELGWKLGPGSRHGCSRSRLGSMGLKDTQCQQIRAALNNSSGTVRNIDRPL